MTKPVTSPNSMMTLYSWLAALAYGTRFRQVELEIRDRKWRGHRVVRRLEKAGARVENDQKLAKAMNLSRLPSPSHTVDEQSTVADVLMASLHAGLNRLVTHDWQLRLRNPDPSMEDVHQARVATRRLRSDLKTFGGVLDPVWLRHVRSDLKWIGTVLGELRDRDVLSDRLSDAPPAVRQRLAVQRRACGERLEDALASDRYLNLVDKLQAGSEQLPFAAGTKDEAQRRAADVLPSLVAARWRPYANRYDVPVRSRRPQSSTGFESSRSSSDTQQMRQSRSSASRPGGRLRRRRTSRRPLVSTMTRWPLRPGSEMNGPTTPRPQLLPSCRCSLPRGRAPCGRTAASVSESRKSNGSVPGPPCVTRTPSLVVLGTDVDTTQDRPIPVSDTCRFAGAPSLNKPSSNDSDSADPSWATRHCFGSTQSGNAQSVSLTPLLSMMLHGSWAPARGEPGMAGGESEAVGIAHCTSSMVVVEVDVDVLFLVPQFSETPGPIREGRSSVTRSRVGSSSCSRR